MHLEWQDQHTQRVARLAPRARLLITRMGGFLARTLKVFTQNRARQKRSFGKAYADWADMLDESTIVDEAVSHVLPLTVYPPYALGALAQYVLLLIWRCIIPASMPVCTGSLVKCRANSTH